MAWNGSEYYVVWEEGSGTGPTQVFGARVSASGTVLDPGGVQLSQGVFNDSVHPRVASGNGKFLVVWEDEPEDDYSDLGAALVRANGTVQKRSFMGGDNSQSHPDVAWNGQLFLAVWQDEPDPSNEDVYGARITADGLTLDGCSSDSCPNGDDTGIPIATNAGNEVLPTVTANTGLFLVAWTDRTDATHPVVRDTAVAVNGSSLDTVGFDLSQNPGNQSQVAAARNGASALFAWADLRSGTSSDVFATTMKPGDEQNYQPTPVPTAGFSVSSASGDQTDPRGRAARRGVRRGVDGHPQRDIGPVRGQGRCRRSGVRPERRADRDRAAHAACGRACHGRAEGAADVHARCRGHDVRRTRPGVRADPRLRHAAQTAPWWRRHGWLRGRGICPRRPGLGWSLAAPCLRTPDRRSARTTGQRTPPCRCVEIV